MIPCYDAAQHKQSDEGAPEGNIIPCNSNPVCYISKVMSVYGWPFG